MLLQTLPLIDSCNSWCSNCLLISRFMKGVFLNKPPKPRYVFTWDVCEVLNFLKTLYPLNSLNAKMLTLKTTALIALASAPRAQTMVNLNLDNMRTHDNFVVFCFQNMLKSYRVGKANSYVIKLEHFEDEKICPMHTLLYYVKFTEGFRKSRQVFISYVSHLAVTSSTIARWLKTVLELSGIDVSVFKSHSYRSASVSAAYNKGCSMSSILKAADWRSDKNFYKFYYRSVMAKDDTFTDTVFRS